MNNKKRKTGKEKLEELMKAFLSDSNDKPFISPIILNTQFETRKDEDGNLFSSLFLHGNKIAELRGKEVLKLFPRYDCSQGKISNTTFSRLSLLNSLALQEGKSVSNISREKGCLVRTHIESGSFKLDPDLFCYAWTWQNGYFVV